MLQEHCELFNSLVLPIFVQTFLDRCFKRCYVSHYTNIHECLKVNDKKKLHNECLKILDIL